MNRLLKVTSVVRVLSSKYSGKKGQERGVEFERRVRARPPHPFRPADLEKLVIRQPQDLAKYFAAAGITRLPRDEIVGRICKEFSVGLLRGVDPIVCRLCRRIAPTPSGQQPFPAFGIREKI